MGTYACQRSQISSLECMAVVIKSSSQQSILYSRPKTRRLDADFNVLCTTSTRGKGRGKGRDLVSDEYERWRK